MPKELIKFYETVGRTAESAYKVGKFVVDHVKGGGWSTLPHPEPGPAHPPQRAHLDHYQTGEHNDSQAA